MKELSIKEKAKRYDEVLKRAESIYNETAIPSATTKGICTYIFPELKESDDEKIRKAIKKALQVKCDGSRIISDEPVTLEEALAWLEKQDKQNPCETCEEPRLNCQNFPCERKKNFKPANKVEPKFHEGDWIVHHGTENVYQVVALIDNQYQLKYGDNYTVQKCDDVDRCARLWDITKDAKNGDVLACKNGWTCIFKTLINNETFSSYCFMDNTKWFCETGSECHTLKEEFVKAYNGKIYPATKEQRDLLFQRMREAGYEWDADKKELKKIEDEEYNGEDYGIDSLFHAQEILERTLGKVDGYQSDDGILEHKCAITAIKKLYEQKPTWSEEDEEMFEHIIAKATLHFSSINYLDEEEINFLKSLKDRYTWKPSEEQMVVLNDIIINGHLSNANERILKGLQEQLKKLREE